jgi:hypothetical protein
MGEKRLLERRLAFEGLLASTFPLALKLSTSPRRLRLQLAVDFQRVVHSVHKRLMSRDRRCERIASTRNSSKM